MILKLLKNEKTVSQLSNTVFVENTGFEPVTPCLPGKYSSQMS